MNWNNTSKFCKSLGVLVILFVSAQSFSHASEFSKPWVSPDVPIILDPYEKNSIEWEKVSTDKRVVGVIHRATIGLRADKEYLNRRNIAKDRDYLWGSYHLGKSGDPVKQADFYLSIIGDADDEVMVLDLENTSNSSMMNIPNARIFLNRVHEVTGRWPLIYAPHFVTKKISDTMVGDEVFQNTRLWYARFRSTIPNFPTGVWQTYTLWQFASEINCKKGKPCPYSVPGTTRFMDINVYNGTLKSIRQDWPFD